MRHGHPFRCLVIALLVLAAAGATAQTREERALAEAAEMIGSSEPHILPRSITDRGGQRWHPPRTYFKAATGECARSYYVGLTGPFEAAALPFAERDGEAVDAPWGGTLHARWWPNVEWQPSTRIEIDSEGQRHEILVPPPPEGAGLTWQWNYPLYVAEASVDFTCDEAGISRAGAEAVLRPIAEAMHQGVLREGLDGDALPPPPAAAPQTRPREAQQPAETPPGPAEQPAAGDPAQGLAPPSPFAPDETVVPFGLEPVPGIENIGGLPGPRTLVETIGTVVVPGIAAVLIAVLNGLFGGRGAPPSAGGGTRAPVTSEPTPEELAAQEAAPQREQWVKDREADLAAVREQQSYINATAQGARQSGFDASEHERRLRDLAERERELVEQIAREGGSTTYVAREREAVKVGEGFKKALEIDAEQKRQAALAAARARLDQLERERVQAEKDYGKDVKENFWINTVGDWDALPGELYKAAHAAKKSVGEIAGAIKREWNDPTNWEALRAAGVKTVADLIASPLQSTRKVTKFYSDVGEVGAKVGGHIVMHPVSLVQGIAGADNWSKAFDPNTPVVQRIGRTLFGIADAALNFAGVGMGAKGLHAADKVMDAAKVADTVSDAAKVVRGADKALEAARAADKVAEVTRAADKVADITRAGDKAADVTRTTDAAAEAARVADKTADTARAADKASDAGRSAKAADAGEAGHGVRAADQAGDSAKSTHATHVAEESKAGKYLDATTAQQKRVRQDAWDQGREVGRRKVDDFEKARREAHEAWKSGDEAAAAAAQGRLRKATMELQGDKQALWEINKRGDTLKRNFNKEMGAVYKETDDKVVAELCKKRGWDPKDYYEQPPGSGIWHNRQTQRPDIVIVKPTNPKAGITVGADRDVTVRVREFGKKWVADPEHPGKFIQAGEKGVLTDVASAELTPIYNRHFYDAAGGARHFPGLTSPRCAQIERELEQLLQSGANPGRIKQLENELLAARADSLAHKADQLCTDRLHPEAYGRGQKDLGVAIRYPGEEFSDALQVSKAAQYKSEHLYQQAHELAAAGRYAEAETAWAEGMRQATKQFNRQVLGRAKALGEQGFTVHVSDELRRAMQIMERTQSIRDKNTGLWSTVWSPARVQTELAKLGTDVEEVTRQSAGLLEAMQKLRPR